MALRTTLTEIQRSDAEGVMAQLIKESEHDLWKALAACEKALARRSLYQRIDDQRKSRELKRIVVRDYRSVDAKAFRVLNEQWVKAYFTMEESDQHVLNDPEGTIIGVGGKVLVAVDRRKTLGVCALKPCEGGRFELMKLAVSPDARGRGIGRLLSEAAIEQAWSLGAKRIYLESNTVLEAAVSL